MRTKPLLSTVVAWCAVLLTAGCASLKSGGMPDASIDLMGDLKRIAETVKTSETIDAYYKAPATDRAALRNRYTTTRLVQIDYHYLLFVRELTNDREQLNAASSLAQMTLGIAGTLVGGARSKANLAAAAAAIAGGKAIIDKEFYFDKNVDALVSTMNARRKQVLVRIYQGLSSETVADYPLERAIGDLVDYFEAGTVRGAIQFIQTQAEATQEVAIRELTYIPTAEETSLVKRMTLALGTVDAAKGGAILQQLGVPAATVATEPVDAIRNRLSAKVKELRTLAGDARKAQVDKLKAAFDAADPNLLKTN